LATKFNGELVSADSRQVYKEINIISGKDLPIDLKPQVSSLKWRNKYLSYFEVNGIRIWLYDVVSPNDEFNVSFWKECADIVIADILGRGKLPIVVGGTGLYIKSLLQCLETLSFPVDALLRNELAKMSTNELFEYLKKVDTKKSQTMNNSDQKNPRRLIRAIEIAKSDIALVTKPNLKFDYLILGLSASLDVLFSKIDSRIAARNNHGAAIERQMLIGKYSLCLPSMSIPGLRDPDNWGLREKQYAKRQMVWFKKQKNTLWFDITETNWLLDAERAVRNWYN